MLNFISIIPIVFMSEAHAKELVARYVGNVQNSTDKLVDKLVDVLFHRVLETKPLQFRFPRDPPAVFWSGRPSFMQTRRGTMSNGMLFGSGGIRRSRLMATFPWQSGATIKQATKEQLTPLSSGQVLDEVAALSTEALYEPSSQEFSKSIETYVYKALIERYGQSQQRRNAFFLAFNSQNEVIGCVGISVVSLTPDSQVSGEDVAERPLLEFLSVDPSARGKGIGMSLVKRIEAEARNWGYDDVVLQVYSDNAVAIRLYEKLGYKALMEDDTIKRPKQGFIGRLSFENAPHLCMRKELGSGMFDFRKLFNLDDSSIQ